MADVASSLTPSPATQAGATAVVLGAALKYGLDPKTLANAGGLTQPTPSVPVQPKPVAPTTAPGTMGANADNSATRAAITSDLLRSGGSGLSASQLLGAIRAPAAPAPVAKTAPPVTAAGVHIQASPSGGVVPYRIQGESSPSAAPGLDGEVQKTASSMGWNDQEVQAWQQVIARESGGNMTAQNPHSNAYGIAQFINGPGEYATYGGDVNTLSGQVTAMANYIRQRYGTPSNAWAHEQAVGWY